MLTLPPFMRDRPRHVLDAFAVGWTLLWVLIGFLVFHEVRGLRSLSDTVIVTGQALDETASTLQAAAALPVIGGEIGALAERAQRTAATAVESGRSSRSGISNLAVLLWIAIAAAPTTPLLVLYALVRESVPRGSPHPGAGK